MVPVLVALTLLVPNNRVADVERGVTRWRDMGYQIAVVPQWRTVCAPTSSGIRICEKVEPGVGGRYNPRGWIELNPISWGNSRIVCHEVGHALGYGHTNDRADCMWSPLARSNRRRY